MERIQSQFVGVELCFWNLEKAKKFYIETMGLVRSTSRPLCQVRRIADEYALRISNGASTQAA